LLGEEVEIADQNVGERIQCGRTCSVNAGRAEDLGSGYPRKTKIEWILHVVDKSESGRVYRDDGMHLILPSLLEEGIRLSDVRIRNLNSFD
jgi:hypothetical protein